MRMSIIGILISIMFFAVMSESAFCQDVEIKGIHLGETKMELQSRWGKSLDMRFFTIAGVNGKNRDLNVEFQFDNEILEGFFFYFDSASFEDVFNAVKSKYPEIKCSESQVANAMGAAFKQKICTMNYTKGKLVLSRFVEDIGTSVLSMISPKSLEMLGKEGEKRNKDI